jgi:hypothetical protein
VRGVGGARLSILPPRWPFRIINRVGGKRVSAPGSSGALSPCRRSAARSSMTSAVEAIVPAIAAKYPPDPECPADGELLFHFRSRDEDGGTGKEIRITPHTVALFVSAPRRQTEEKIVISPSLLQAVVDGIPSDGPVPFESLQVRINSGFRLYGDSIPITGEGLVDLKVRPFGQRYDAGFFLKWDDRQIWPGEVMVCVLPLEGAHMVAAVVTAMLDVDEDMTAGSIVDRSSQLTGLWSRDGERMINELFLR